MKIKSFFAPFLCLLCYSASMDAQTPQIKGFISGQAAGADSYMAFDDNASYKITYKFEFAPDNEYPDEKKEALTVLLVGKKHTLFADYYSIISDSVKTELIKQGEGANAQLSKLLPISKKIKFSPRIVNNYPEKGKALFQETLGKTTYRYIDPSTSVAWTLTDSVKNISGYVCKNAVCDYKGRQYSAWYSPDVALYVGPYTFNGLPGLIFEVRDFDNEFVFTLEGLEQLKVSQPIQVSNRKVAEISRDEFRKIKKNLAENPAEILKLLSGKANVSSSAIKGVQSRPFNPIEKE